MYLSPNFNSYPFVSLVLSTLPCVFVVVLGVGGGRGVGIFLSKIIDSTLLINTSVYISNLEKGLLN